jgi:hypothetical protein
MRGAMHANCGWSMQGGARHIFAGAHGNSEPGCQSIYAVRMGIQSNSLSLKAIKVK